jgi:hypothetical protein
MRYINTACMQLLTLSDFAIYEHTNLIMQEQYTHMHHELKLSAGKK